MKYKFLSSCCDYQTVRVSSKNISNKNYITTENMLPNRGGVTSANSIPEGSCCKYSQNNILISNIRLYFKKIWYATNTGGCSNDVLVLKAKNNTNPKFLYYALSDSNFFNYADVTSKGTKMPRGSKIAIMKYLVPDVDITIQDKIANILSTYDKLIENNKKRINILEKIADNIYKEWFVRFRFPGYDHVRMTNGIPFNWDVKSIECVSGVLQRGISPEYNDSGKYNVISQKCIRTSIMDITESRRQDKDYKEAINIVDGDTLICSTGTGTLGRVGKVFGYFPNTTIDSHVTLVRSKKEIGKHFLFYSLKQLQPYFMNMGIGSTNQQELYRSTIKNAKIVVPDKLTLNKFEDIIEKLHRNIVFLINKNKNLTKQRDLLLPRLMSGKIEIQ